MAMSITRSRWPKPRSRSRELPSRHRLSSRRRRSKPILQTARRTARAGARSRKSQGFKLGERRSAPERVARVERPHQARATREARAAGAARAAREARAARQAPLSVRRPFVTACAGMLVVLGAQAQEESPYAGRRAALQLGRLRHRNHDAHHDARRHRPLRDRSVGVPGDCALPAGQGRHERDSGHRAGWRGADRDRIGLGTR